MVTARRHSQVRRPNGSQEMSVRSVRVEDATWAKAKRRAEFDGVTVSNAVAQIVEGYAAGFINLPRRQVVYTPTKQPEEEKEASQ